MRTALVLRALVTLVLLLLGHLGLIAAWIRRAGMTWRTRALEISLAGRFHATDVPPEAPCPAMTISSLRPIALLPAALLLALVCCGSEGGEATASPVDDGGLDGSPDANAQDATPGGDSGRADAAVADAAPDGAGTTDAATTGPVSCVGLAATCGADGSKDCCSSALVPGGTLDRGNDPGSQAKVSAFRLDTYEVTVGRFRRFVQASGGTRVSPPAAGAAAHPAIPGSGWQSAWNADLEPDAASLMAKLRSGPGATWTDAPGANEERPVNHVVWIEAFAFCAWDGGRLPTEAELGFATVGGSEQRVYPWSAPATSTVIDPTYATYACLADGQPACSSADLRKVGGASPKGDGRWGHADLAGSVAEWTLDEWNAIRPSPCTDCARVPSTSGGFRVVSGGDYQTDPSDLTGAKRRDLSAFYRWDRQGFRCARLP